MHENWGQMGITVSSLIGFTMTARRRRRPFRSEVRPEKTGDTSQMGYSYSLHSGTTPMLMPPPPTLAMVTVRVPMRLQRRPSPGSGDAAAVCDWARCRLYSMVITLPAGKPPVGWSMRTTVSSMARPGLRKKGADLFYEPDRPSLAENCHSHAFSLA